MIRDAAHEDIPSMLAMGREMHAESVFARFSYDEAKVGELIGTLIDLDSGIALVSELAGELQGGFIGAVYPHWFGTDLQATDYALFLGATHRNGRIAARLIKAYIDHATEKGAKQIMLSNSTGYQPDRVAALYESLDFKKRGYVFEYEP